MPLGLWETNGRVNIAGTLAMMLVAILMLACDELATQLEHP